MVVTAVASAMPGASQLGVPRQRRKSQFDKLLAVHDRKGELRAEILGISALNVSSDESCAFICTDRTRVRYWFDAGVSLGVIRAIARRIIAPRLVASED